MLHRTVAENYLSLSAYDQAEAEAQRAQALGEGLTLFVLLWWFGRKPRARGRVGALFLLGYGCLRFAAEFFREPDSFLGFLALGLSMGQWLCIPMIVAGVLMWVWATRRQPPAPGF